MAIIIPHQLSLAPPPVPPPVFSGPLPNPQRSAFLFPAIFSPVSFGLLPRSLCSAPSFLSVSFLVPFVPHLRFLCSALSFSSFRLLVSFWLLLRFLRSVSCFLWTGSTRHCLVVSSFPTSFSPPLCQVFSSLSNPTHAFLCWRPCPSTFENTPFLPQEHALQRSRTRPSPLVSVCVWFRVSCKFRFVSCPPPSVLTFVCFLVKFFHKPKRLVGSFFSHVV